MVDIINLFYYYYNPFIEESAKVAGIEEFSSRSIKIYVEPNYSDACTVLIVQPGINNIVRVREEKAWHLAFETPENMEADLEEECQAILRHIR